MKLPARIATLKAKTLRDVVTYLIGAGGLVFETLTNGVEKPTLIIAFVGMLGLPLFLNKDEKDAKVAVPPIPPAADTSILIPTPHTPESP